MSDHGTRIRTFRLLKGLSQEDMAEQLGITQSTYSRIEGNDQKLTVDMLKRIADILGIGISDITNNEPIIIQNNASNHGAQGKFEHFYADQKEVYEKLLTAKDEEISRLQKIIESLLKDKEQMMDFFKRQ